MISETNQPEKPRFSVLRDFRKAWPGILISLICLIVAFRVTDLEAIGRSFTGADYRYFPWAVGAFFLAMATRTLAWRETLGKRASFHRVFLSLSEGYLFNNLLPFRLGEFARAFLLSRTSDIPFLQILSTIVIERLFDLIMVAAVLLLTLPYVIGAEWARSIAVTISIFLIVGVFLLHLFARNWNWFFDKFQIWQDKVPVLKKINAAQIETFSTGLETLTDFRRFVSVSWWMVLSWTFVIVEYYLLALAFFPDAKFIWAAFGIGVMGLGFAIPSAPGGIGVVEISLVGALSLFGVGYSEALAYSVVVHGLTLIFTSVIGIYALVLDGESFINVYNSFREGLTRSSNPKSQD